MPKTLLSIFVLPLFACGAVEPVADAPRDAQSVPSDGSLADGGGAGEPEGAAGDRIVFVTSTAYEGNLGGLAGADAKCDARAAAAGLRGRFKAWLSDSADSPATRFVPSATPYLRVDGVRVADDWADLTDGTLQAPIAIDEAGRPSEENAWTATTADGTPLMLLQNCSDWSSSGGSPLLGTGGDPTATTERWSYSFGAECRVKRHLYCVQQ